MSLPNEEQPIDGEPSVEAPPDKPRRFPCSNCGAILTWSPGTGALTCSYCGTSNPVPESDIEVRELDFETHLAALGEGAPVEATMTVKCGSCAAEFTEDPKVTATSCPFCGSSVVSSPARSERLAPGYLLPFAIEARDASTRFRDWLSSRWFAPNALKHYARADDRLVGMYVPYWTYDAGTTTRYSGMRGQNYTTTVRTSKGTRTVTKIRWYPTSGVVHVVFDDVMVVAAGALPRPHMEALEPWDLENLAPYSADYLSGFRSEMYDIDLREGFQHAAERMRPEIVRAIKADIGGDHQRISSMETAYSNVRFKHVLMPTWLAAYRFRDQVYRFVVNGRTGEVQGERPWSWVKIGAAALAAALAIGAVVWVIASNQ